MAVSELVFNTVYAVNYKLDFREKWRILTLTGDTGVRDLLITIFDLNHVHHDLCDVPIQLLLDRRGLA